MNIEQIAIEALGIQGFSFGCLLDLYRRFADLQSEKVLARWRKMNDSEVLLHLAKFASSLN